MGIVWTIWSILIGCIVGLIARAVLPGTQTMGVIMTTVLGVVGALLVAFQGQKDPFAAVAWWSFGGHPLPLACSMARSS